MKRILITFICFGIIITLTSCKGIELENPNQETSYNENTSNLDFEKEFPDEDTRTYAKKYIGKQAPNFTVTELNGTTIELNKLKGNKVVLEIAQTACESCLEVYPLLEKFKKDNPDIVFLRIYPNDSKETISDFYDDNDILQDLNVVAGNGRTSILDLYDVKYTPTLHFIDENGIIQYTICGTFNEEMLNRYVKIAFEK